MLRCKLLVALALLALAARAGPAASDGKWADRDEHHAEEVPTDFGVLLVTAKPTPLPPSPQPKTDSPTKAPKTDSAEVVLLYQAATHASASASASTLTPAGCCPG